MKLLYIYSIELFIHAGFRTYVIMCLKVGNICLCKDTLIVTCYFTNCLHGCHQRWSLRVNLFITDLHRIHMDFTVYIKRKRQIFALQILDDTSFPSVRNPSRRFIKFFDILNCFIFLCINKITRETIGF